MKRIDGILHIEDVSCVDLAQQYSTPLYIYSRRAIEDEWYAFDNALDGLQHLVCYAVKANSNIGILSLLVELGSGFDIVSQGELERVLVAGGDTSKIIFSGVGKTRTEMERALEVNIRCFNVESVSELERLEEVARVHGCIAPVSLRVNPDVDAKTHPYISTGMKENKFGILMEHAEQAYQFSASSDHLSVQGVDCHIGSQLTDVQPFVDALDRLLVLIEKLNAQGIRIKHIDLGGGQGVRYKDESPLDLVLWSKAVKSRLDNRDLEVVIEPGRSIVANAGMLLTEIQYLKLSDYKNFAVVDAAMNDLIRPSLYDAWQEIVEVEHLDYKMESYDVVGPVCESSDFLGKERQLKIGQGDLLAVKSSGAYAFTMSSNYNSRPRAAEVIIDGKTSQLVRRRETIPELFESESVYKQI